MAAIYSGLEEFAKLLIVAGANVEHKCSNEDMYEWAVRHRRERVARFIRLGILIRSGRRTRHCN